MNLASIIMLKQNDNSKNLCMQDKSVLRPDTRNLGAEKVVIA